MCCMTYGIPVYDAWCVVPLLLLLQLLSSMDHPNIIKYYDSFLDSEGALCIATTYCEGEQRQLAGQQPRSSCL